MGLLADGKLHTSRIKLYAAQQSRTPELRGLLTRVEPEPDGRVWIGGVPFRTSPSTSFKGDALRPVMSRAEVRSILRDGALAASRQGIQVKWELFDLEQDPSETSPMESVHELDRASAELRELSRRLDLAAQAAERDAHWAERGSGLLDKDLLDQLRALGYVR